MANKPRERLKKLVAAPPFKVGPSGIDWYTHPQRADVANKALWLWYSDIDQPVKKAFDFFGFDPSDPRHWRVLIVYLASAQFPSGSPGAPRGQRTLTRNAELLARGRREYPGKRDSEIARKLAPKVDIPEGSLRRILRSARRQEQEMLKKMGN